MVTKRHPDEIRENDIVNFIITVRKLSCQTTDLNRNMKRIKNLANTIFRHYIGYTARGEYRLKSKDERCFSEEVKEKGIENPFGKLRSVNPRLEKLAEVNMVDLVESAGNPGPSPNVEFVDLEDFEASPEDEGSLHRAGDEGFEEPFEKPFADDEAPKKAKKPKKVKDALDELVEQTKEQSADEDTDE